MGIPVWTGTHGNGPLEGVLAHGLDHVRSGLAHGLHLPEPAAAGHVAALAWMNGRSGVEIFNLGTGTGSSVLDVIKAFSAACGKELPYVIEPRRAGDVTANYADCTKAREEMGWEAQYDLADMCRDSWNWQSHNPNGYED